MASAMRASIRAARAYAVIASRACGAAIQKWPAQSMQLLAVQLLDRRAEAGSQ